jgi:protein-tyrosine-phosphatase
MEGGGGPVQDLPAEADDGAGDGTRILFVCTANICRSPMAEAIFNALVSDAGAPYEARSAGVAALVGKPLTPHARAVLEEAGVPVGRHRARQVDRAMLEEADLVLAMTPEHVAALHRLAGEPSEKIGTLPSYAKGVPDAEGTADPYGMPISTYRASEREIFGYVDRVVRMLQV